MPDVTGASDARRYGSAGCLTLPVRRMPDVTGPPDARRYGCVGSLQLAFAYPDSSENVLERVSFNIEAVIAAGRT